MYFLLKVVSFLVISIICSIITVLGLNTYLKHPTFSIIISNYNYEKYLPATIQSILDSTYTDFEIILINDGSTDSSLDVINYYAQKDKRIKVINQKNQGLSAARNNGIKMARGRYLWFVDADDWIDRVALEKMNTSIQNTKANAGILPDIISFYVQPVNDLGEKQHLNGYHLLPPEIETYQNHPYDGSKLSYYTLSVFPATSGKQIYRRDYIVDKNIIFPIGLYFEDECFFMSVLLSGAKGIAMPTKLYYKREHTRSITANRNKHYDSTVRLPMVAYQWVKKVGVSEDKARWIFQWHFEGVFSKWTNQYKHIVYLKKLLSFIEKQPTDEFWIKKAKKIKKFIAQQKKRKSK